MKEEQSKLLALFNKYSTLDTGQHLYKLEEFEQYHVLFHKDKKKSITTFYALTSESEYREYTHRLQEELFKTSTEDKHSIL